MFKGEAERKTEKWGDHVGMSACTTVCVCVCVRVSV